MSIIDNYSNHDSIFSIQGVDKIIQSEMQMINLLQCLDKTTLSAPVEYHSYRNYPGDGNNEREAEQQSPEREQTEENREYDSFEDYVFTRFSSNWGGPLISVEDERIDIARVKKVLNGNLIIFAQNDFWRNKYLGSNESNEPNDRAKASINLLYNFLDILKIFNEK